MKALYAVALIVGFVALIIWILGTFLPSGVNERLVARRVVGGLIAFGMGGLSASYAGWSGWGALAAGVIGAGVIVWYVGRT
jgi:hypothetical protein